MHAKLSFYFSLILSVLLIAACTTVSAKPNPNTPITVKITGDEYSFKSTLTTFTVGQPYHFVLTNTGKIPHELMIIKPIPAGTMDMEAMDKMALAHVTEEDWQAGETATMDYTFTQADAAGPLEFACHIPGHYEAGMKESITVK